MSKRVTTVGPVIGFVAFGLLMPLFGASGVMQAGTRSAEPPGEMRDSTGGGMPTVVFVLRHAEKRTDDPRDPQLSDAGVERAEALAELLAPAGVTHLFSSEYRRTRETLRPLARRIGREPVIIPASTMEDQVRAIRDLPSGSVAVVAGHANTVPDLVSALGGEVTGLVDSAHGPILSETTYDRLFQVILPGTTGSGEGRVRTLEMNYGG